MKNEIRQKVDLLKDDIIKSIIESVNIPSVIDEGKGGHPFGENIDKVLRHTLKLCENLGFKTVYKDGYYGYAEIGEGSELIGILGHLDVVPEGNVSDWKYPPYDATLEGSKLYGRGTQDDKGPTIACIYAVAALNQLGVKFNKRIRFIFGTDEENLWRDIAKYKENNEEIPSYGFTPDSKFPMINAEKGLLQVYLSDNNEVTEELEIGGALNAVPAVAEYEGILSQELVDELEKLNFNYKKEGNKISVLGKSVHSSVSDTGINAVARMAIALNNIGFNSKVIKFVAEVIGEDANGNNIVKNCHDEVSGKLTCNVGKIQIKDNIHKVGIDCRIPVTYNKEDFAKALKEKASEYKLEYMEYDYLASIYVPEDNFLVKTLKNVFEEETKLEGTPLSSGGATYARALDNCVAFGPVFPGKPKTEHQVNEYIDVDDLMEAAKIYSIAIYELLKG